MEKSSTDMENKCNSADDEKILIGPTAFYFILFLEIVQRRHILRFTVPLSCPIWAYNYSNVCQ